ncbi:zinc finger protein 236-like [Wyeomyia smithii]|uniref:zinc finger protein 236-like n=1 Tax=Wyeomyia smithii TaxID=174621 RepID=UPI002468150B|nr:zinc finger protein 236-like [Wyeomyia smithii]XP_055540252.1 zinc finger protein 236-like [Wyeomyia smithii]XP_055540253.1 zinc finger protein 236-like [Wyeomyia smithii]
MLHEESELDDTHLCNKCGRTVVGLENYIKHRKVSCVQPKPATSGAASRIGTEPGFTPFDFGEGIKDPEHHKKLPNYSFNYELETHHNDPVQRPDSKTDYKNEVNYDYELGADLFFSSLELQSSSKKGATVSTAAKPNIPARTKARKPTTSLSNTDPDHEQDHEDDWIAPHHDSEKLMKAVSDISGNKKMDSLFTFFPHESPEPSEDESDEEEDFDAPPRTHTGGKWKPENRPSSSQWRHWPDQEGQLDKSIEPEEDEEYKSFSPPPGHTKGKWVPGSKITRLEYKTPSLPSKAYDDNYWCSICNRKLASRFVYERHLKSNLHQKRAQEESELERAVKPSLYPNELSKRITKPPVYLGDDFFTSNLSPEKTSTPTSFTAPDVLKISPPKVKRKRKSYYMKCEICKTRLPTNLLGKHLISRYHYRRMLNHPDQCFDIILKNIHRIVLQSPFQCHPCKFYANTEQQFMSHWNSLEHEQRVQGGGKFWCSFCKYECNENFHMTNHLIGSDHREVISVINRSVPIIIRKITPIVCEFCGDEFRYNAELKRHHEACNEGNPEDTNRVKRTFQNTFSCDICKTTFQNQMLLLQHGQKLHRLAHYYCSICEVSFQTPKESLQHRRTTSHKVMSARKRHKAGLPPKKCHVCQRQLADILELKNHIRVDHPEIKYSCPQCGENFVLAQELGRHVRDKNCTFFNSVASSSSSSPSTAAPAAATDGRVLLAVAALVPAGSTAKLESLPSTSRAHLPGENSIILNDSIKVNMNDHKVRKESHLYSSTSSPAGAMSRNEAAGFLDETIPRAATHSVPTATDEPRALRSLQAVTMIEHYSNLPPSSASRSTTETQRVAPTTYHHPGPASLSQSDPLSEAMATTASAPTATQSTTTTSNFACDDNIVASSSASAEIFFAMANNASENNTVYVDEIVGTITEDSTLVSWQCKICLFRTTSQASFLYHEILHSSNAANEPASGKSTKITCPLCKKQFSKASLRCHLRQHTDERIFPCELCPMSFTRKANLKNHVAYVHGEKKRVVVKSNVKRNPSGEKASVDEPPSKRGSEICSTCGKTFASSKILAQHATVHLEQKSIKEFACQHERCFYIGRSAADVRAHLLSRHSDERNFVCSEPGCDYRGKTITQLRRHYQRHEETVKKYKCDQCEFASRIPGHLKRHLLVHSGGKPFTCPHCDYSCNNIENLRKHVISTAKHKGKYLYECKYCSMDGPEAVVFKTNFHKEYKDHLQGSHSLSAEEASQVARIVPG